MIEKTLFSRNQLSFVLKKMKIFYFSGKIFMCGLPNNSCKIVWKKSIETRENWFYTFSKIPDYLFFPTVPTVFFNKAEFYVNKTKKLTKFPHTLSWALIRTTSVKFQKKMINSAWAEGLTSLKFFKQNTWVFTILGVCLKEDVVHFHCITR